MDMSVHLVSNASRLERISTKNSDAHLTLGLPPRAGHAAAGAVGGTLGNTVQARPRRVRSSAHAPYGAVVGGRSLSAQIFLTARIQALVALIQTLLASIQAGMIGIEVDHDSLWSAAAAIGSWLGMESRLLLFHKANLIAGNIKE